jgi:hypothetical protein
VIRQAISCDICGAQRRETNHWFIAYEKCGELRICDGTSRHLLCPGTKHLCGESCLHRLLSEFLAETMVSKAPKIAMPLSDDFRGANTLAVLKRNERHRRHSLHGIGELRFLLWQLLHSDAVHRQSKARTVAAQRVRKQFVW